VLLGVIVGILTAGVVASIIADRRERSVRDAPAVGVS
jgi:hypothetical protein